MIKKLGLGLGLIMVGVLAIAALQSSKFHIEREIIIHATPEKIFPYINNSELANEWMPWQSTDPDAKMSFSGPSAGVGSTTRWDSPGRMGTGEAKVVESVENQFVKTQLSYTRPMAMSQLATVSLAAADSGTRVRWEVDGNNTFPGRVICLFMNMDKMVGGEFEKGLKNLQAKVERN